MNSTITMQKKGGVWTDEAGNTIPYSYIKEVEKVNEKITYNIAKSALKAHQVLVDLKTLISDGIDEAIAAFHKEYKGKKTEFKGNYTIYNFDRSIKLEVNVSNPIQFDDLLINEAKTRLDEMLNDGLSAKNKAVKEMVMAAFQTSRGKMDVKKILALKKYAERIDDPRYGKAMKLIDQAIRRPMTATYYRVWIRNDKGAYDNVPLSLADIT